MEYRLTELTALAAFHPDLRTQILAVAEIVVLPANTEILREGQYIKVLPIVIEGLIKVYTRHEDKELLLYYIKPEESCIMSFSAGMKNDPSKVFAVTEKETKAILLPVNLLPAWIKDYPDLNKLFFNLYDVRYTELLLTINHLLFDRMDKRLYEHLLDKMNVTGKNPLEISHRQLANELGTAREVISRVMKRLEQEGKVKQQPNAIEIVTW